MKTIGTITFHDSINYGAILQTYALQKVLVDLGFRSEIIDYNHPHRGVRSLSRLRRIRHYLWQNLFKKLLAGSKRQIRTDEFRRKYLVCSPSKYFNAKTLHSSPPLYDAYITGSDQVWNPRINDKDSSYFLTFAPREKKRVSYAASFGVGLIQGEHVEDYRQWLTQIDSLSTREVEGNQIIKRLTGRDANIVLDPTLLLGEEQWRQVAIPHDCAKPYLLAYYMPGDAAVNKSITRIARQISAATGWTTICIGQKEYMRLLPWKRSVIDAGPAEFLGLVQNASFIVTNSFHGTVFSVTYQKPFLVPINQSLPPEKALSSRITSLLKTLDLEHRLLPAGKESSVERTLDMNYQPVEMILHKERQRSIDFLKDALAEV